MTIEDIAKIEKELELNLPEAYIKLVTTCKAPGFIGNADTDIWDNVDEIIRRNGEVRRAEDIGGREPWPKTLFFIGDPLTACANAIDLSTPAKSVHWIDHCDISAKSSGKSVIHSKIFLANIYQSY